MDAVIQKPVDPVIKNDTKTKKVKRERPSDDDDDVFMAEDDLEDLSDLMELVKKSLPGQQFYVPKRQKIHHRKKQCISI